MKTDIWMPWYPSDYLKRTLELNLEEDAVYRRALDYLWQNPLGLPWVTARLCRCLRIDESELYRCLWVLEKFLEKHGDVYRSSRIDKEQEKASKRREIAIENGKKGGRPQSNNRLVRKPSGLAKHNPEHNPTPNPEKSSSPSPSPSPSESQSSSEEPFVDLGRPVDLKNKAVREIFEFWKVELNHSKSKLDLKRERAIKARLKDGYTVDDIKLAITGIKLCPHNMGQNDRNTVFDDIELICRSSSNVDRFISAHEIKNGNGSEHAKNVGYNKNGISKTRQREIDNQRVIDRFLAANAQPEPENSGQGNGDSE